MIRKLIILFTATIALTACHHIEEWDNDAKGNFEALWTVIDEHYCFFKEKDIDWNAIHKKYSSRVYDGMSSQMLFSVCADMVNELQDGHVNLASWFDTSYYRNWWSDYPQDFDLRTLQQYYLDFNYLSTSGMYYYLLPDNIGYIYYPSFSAGVSELALDYILGALQDTDGLILDIRDNGGGLLTNIDTFVGRFIDYEIPGGSICHKTGPGHADFSKPYPFTYKPCDSFRVQYLGKPIALLTNRSCYSAANAFAAVMKSLPNVTLIGARTGGGGGLPWSSELPNGWSVRFSAAPLYGPDGEVTEFGIDPTPGFECHSPAEQLAEGMDAILDLALAYLNSLVPEKPNE